MKHLLSLLLLTSCCLSLCACSLLAKNKKQSALCNELQSKIIFGGSTSNPRLAQIQNAEEANVAHSYRTHNCDQ